MHPLTAVNHILNFMAPAAWMALALALLGALVYRGRPSKPGRWWRRMVLDFVVGLLVLVAGLLLWGRDGKMLTYLALVLACASSHWVGRRR
jgi:hypothetical protein